jgi:hypothetical protein
LATSINYRIIFVFLLKAGLGLERESVDDSSPVGEGRIQIFLDKQPRLEVLGYFRIVSVQ